MIKVKDYSVKLDNICPQIVLALSVAQDAYKDQGVSDVVITSANDAKHSKTSLHYSGAAVDLRVWNLRDPRKAADDISQALGVDFDCIYEGDHIHLEFQPKRRDI